MIEKNIEITSIGNIENGNIIVADIDGVESQYYTSDTVLGVEGSKVCLQKLGWIEVTRLVRL